MTQFANAEDFVGEYVGVYDGRQASLTISRVKETDTLLILFKDVDRNQEYEGLYSVPLGSDIHTLGPINLYDTHDANNAIYWSILNLHTWDINYLSGLSFWTTQPIFMPPTGNLEDTGWEMEYGWAWNWLFGISFARRIPATPVVNP